MSFFSQASLVMIPSGYKASKVYSAVPTDGAGDLSFTRTADTATRVGPDGLIEKVRTNVLTYSNDFSNAAWGKSNATLTGGQSGYDGSTDGWKIEATATSCYISQGTYSVLRNHSIYAKAGTFNLVSIIVGGYGQGVTFNLTTGAVVTNTSSALYSPVITSVGSGWYRISVGIQAAAPAYGMLIAPNDISGGTIAAGEFIYIQAAQTEYNDIATDYIATTSAAVSVGPVANVPRLDYLNSSCPRLLLEPQRTNFATYNEAFSNWSTTAGTITSNATTSPDGYVDADLFTEDTTTGYHRFANSCTGATGTTKTYSVYAKWAGGTGRKWLTIDNGPISYFDLENGVLGISGANCTSSITAVGNGWYRCVVTHTASIYATLFIGSSNVNGGAGNHLGNGQPAFYVWGAQCEDNASYATSVIPTLGAAVTRGADACSKTGISSLIGQTEGTLFAEFTMVKSGDTYQSILIGNGTQRVYFFYIQTFDKFGWSVSLGGVGFGDTYTTTTPTNGDRYKVAIAYKSGDHALYINGTLVDSKTNSIGTGTLDRFGYSYLGSELFNMPVHQTLLFKTRLSNADLAALTA